MILFSNFTRLTRQQWHAQRDHPDRMERADGEWNRITLHHEGSDEARDPPTTGEQVAGRTRALQSRHINKEEWGDAGYFSIIGGGGQILEGRSLRWVGAHVKGHNPGNLGVCVLGHWDHATPADYPRVISALAALLSEWCLDFGIDPDCIVGHRDLAETVCPGQNLHDALPMIRKLVLARICGRRELYT